MAELTRNKLTLMDLAKREDPNGDTAAIVEVLTEDNEILQDAIWTEGNDTFSNLSTQRSSLPSGTWRRINRGAGTEVSDTRQIVDTLGMLVSYAECDKTLADAAADPKAFRMSEASAFLEGLGQTLAEAMVYANGNIDPEQPTGLAPRLNTLSGTGTSKNTTLGCSGTGSDLTSVYLVNWSLNGTFMFYPRNQPNMGIKHQDLGEVTLEEYDSSGASTGRKFQGYRDYFEVKAGMAVKDPRTVGRVCNIETSGSSNLWSDDVMLNVMNRMKKRGQGSKAYCNGTVLAQIDSAVKDKTNVNFTSAEIFGVPVQHFRGVPIRRVDQILDTETQVS
ncbi:MAG: hypothetical protein RDU24_08820 [Humidesulfovibrio sp.]|uniref:major capsid protein n=1 Tax=Humidesulfovibrio sp. TaxID=2910988 RepID=UPI0027FA7434|nr:hypothetical protein [Humidesulfovibrio sp.]MDQ7835470.1 hypothetical protein [Humidesulfovibrio sp.]